MNHATQHFVAQRISAVVLIFLGLWFAGSMSGLDSFEHVVVVAFIAAPLNSVLLALLCATLAYHSYLGVQVVVEDYVHTPGLVAFSLVASRIAHTFVALASVYAVFKIGLAA